MIAEVDMPNIERFVVSVFIGIAMSIYGVFLVHWILDELIDLKFGLISLFAILPMMWLAIYPPHPVVQYAILLIVVASAAFLPQAIKYLAHREHLEVDLVPMERASAAIAQHPDNVQALFEIAKWLAHNRLYAQAVAIGDKAAARLSPEQDPITNRSVRDLYRSELQELEEWRAMDNVRVLPIVCLNCQHQNPADAVLCEKCGHPHILEQAKASLSRTADIGRLVCGWTITAAIITVCAAVAYARPDVAAWVILAVLVVGLGALWAVFRDKPLVR